MGPLRFSAVILKSETRSPASFRIAADRLKRMDAGGGQMATLESARG